MIREANNACGYIQSWSIRTNKGQGEPLLTNLIALACYNVQYGYSVGKLNQGMTLIFKIACPVGQVEYKTTCP